METQTQTILPFDGSKVYLNKITYPIEIPEQNENSFITFSQLLQTKDNSSIERAFLTSYIWDQKFVCKHFTGQYPLSVACHWAPPKREGKKTINVNGRDIEVIHPSFPDDIEGNVHCKLLLLFFSKSIRVIVTSANLQTRDWDALFQVVWAQDFPIKEKEGTSEFEETLTSFVNSLSAENIASLLKNYDFSDAKVKLITSVPGIHSKDKQQYGHIRLRSLLSQIAHFSEPSTLDYQTATIGAIRKDWMFTEFMQSCLGSESLESTTVNTRVLFPTHQEIVSASYTEGGRAICCWDKSGVVKKHLYHLNSISKGVLLHSKIIQRRADSGKSWTYAGSHNLSASAWGRLVNGDLYVNNYELGVLFQSSNNVSITLPFGLSPSPYEGVGDKPWLIPNKPKVIISNANSITLGLFVLPQKHIFLPKPEHVKSITGATMVLPTQPCINIMRFGSCKYGDTCRYSHVYHPVELTGTAQEVFEGARLVMSLLTRNTFSMGAVITVENTVIQGWIWNITEQWRYTLFVPDPKHPLAKQFNIDVLLVNDIPVEKWLHELSWLTGAASTVVPARNYVTEVRPKKDGELPVFNNTFSINGEQTTYSKLVYIFGTKGSIKTFVSDVSILAKKPQHEKEEQQTQEYTLKEEKIA